MSAQPARELPGWGDSSPPEPSRAEIAFSNRMDELRGDLPRMAKDDSISPIISDIIDLALDYVSGMTDEKRYQAFRALSHRLESALIGRIDSDIKLDAQP